MRKVPLTLLEFGKLKWLKSCFSVKLIQLVVYQKELGNAKRHCCSFHLQLTCPCVDIDVQARCGRYFNCFSFDKRVLSLFLGWINERNQKWLYLFPKLFSYKEKSSTSYFRLMCTIILDWEVTDLAVQNWINEVLHLIVFWPKSFYVLLSPCKVQECKGLFSLLKLLL